MKSGISKKGTKKYRHNLFFSDLFVEKYVLKIGG